MIIAEFKERLFKELNDHIYGKGCFDDYNYSDTQRAAMEDMCFIIQRFERKTR